MIEVIFQHKNLGLAIVRLENIYGAAKKKIYFEKLSRGDSEI